MESPDIFFGKLGIEFMKVQSVAFTIFGIEIYWYALFIASGFIGGLVIASIIAKRTGQDPEIYSDFLMYCLIAAIAGARLYYVAFEWDSYKDNLIDIFAIREGGLAIYGGIIASIITLYIYTKVKKLDFWIMCDTAAPGLIFGQMIGRFGNFMNREAFGGYTDNVFAMSIKESTAKYVPAELMDKIVTLNGVDYIQVHPTFLYESLWSLGLLIIMLVYFKHRKFTGEIFFIYLFGYGLGRSWIEGLRTDQLIIGETGIPASQLLAVILVIVSVVVIIIKRRKNRMN